MLKSRHSAPAQLVPTRWRAKGAVVVARQASSSGSKASVSTSTTPKGKGSFNIADAKVWGKTDKGSQRPSSPQKTSQGPIPGFPFPRPSSHGSNSSSGRPSMNGSSPRTASPPSRPSSSGAKQQASSSPFSSRGASSPGSSSSASPSRTPSSRPSLNGSGSSIPSTTTTSRPSLNGSGSSSPAPPLSPRPSLPGSKTSTTTTATTTTPYSSLPSTTTALATTTQPPPVDPFQEKNKYNDSLMDMALITLAAKGLCEEMAAEGQVVYTPALCSYEDLVRVSKAVMRGRTPEAQAELVLRLLKRVLSPEMANMYKSTFTPSQWTSEVNALVATQAFFWLVGATELRAGPVSVGPGVRERQQKSIVYIKKCRFLEHSGCVGMCVNLCKTATQRFLSDYAGIPVTLNPNFEDLSCEMVFGQYPPPREIDDAFKQPCFAAHCSVPTAMDTPKPCPQMVANGRNAVAPPSKLGL
mmetsp:Transcript_26927/g.58816  ORF Transcript_26927/g.58816 Transcript_26927/m.58816 type:complete len:468 (+) Transcript_26927:324-1727(+)